MENVSVVLGDNGLPSKVVCKDEEFSVTSAVFCGKMEELNAYAYKIRLLVNDDTVRTTMLYETPKDFLISKLPVSKKHKNHRYYISRL